MNFLTSAYDPYVVSTPSQPQGSVNVLGGGGDARYIITVVGDMTGDGLPDILFQLPDSSVIYVYRSDTRYTTYTLRSLGDARSQIL